MRTGIIIFTAREEYSAVQSVVTPSDCERTTRLMIDCKLDQFDAQKYCKLYGAYISMNLIVILSNAIMLSITLFTEFSSTGTYLNNKIALSYMYVTKNAKTKLSTILNNETTKQKLTERSIPQSVSN